MQPRKAASRAVAALCVMVWVAPVVALDAETLEALSILEWRQVTDARVLSAAWLADGSAVAYGAYSADTGEPIVALAPPGPGHVRRLSGVASPHFAVAPRGRVVAYWQEVASEVGATAELSLIDLATESISTLGAPRSVNPAMHLAWLDEGRILFTFQRSESGVASLFCADIRGGTPTELLRLDQCTWTALERTPGDEIVGHLRSSAGMRRFRVSVGDSGEVITSPADTAFAREGAPVELDPDGRLIRSTSPTEAVIIDSGVTGLCFRRPENTAIYTRSHSLMVTGLGGSEPRMLYKLPRQAPPLTGCAWSATLTEVCAWSGAASPGGLWCGRLGTEIVDARFRFGGTSEVAGGSRIWVALRFMISEKGIVTEPDWQTLKACFVVTRVLRSSEFTIAEARSVGAQGGVVERLTGSADPPPVDEHRSHIRIGAADERPREWMSSFRAQPLPGLGGWLEKTPEVGAILSVDVERRELMPQKQNEFAAGLSE